MRNFLKTFFLTKNYSSEVFFTTHDPAAEMCLFTIFLERREKRISSDDDDDESDLQQSFKTEKNRKILKIEYFYCKTTDKISVQAKKRDIEKADFFLLLPFCGIRP